MSDGERLAALLAELGFVTASGSPATLHAFAELLLGEFRAAHAERGPRRSRRADDCSRTRSRRWRACKTIR